MQHCAMSSGAAASEAKQSYKAKQGCETKQSCEAKVRALVGPGQTRPWTTADLADVPYYPPEHALADCEPVARHCRLSVLRGEESAKSRSRRAAGERPEPRPLVVFVHGGSWRRGSRLSGFYAGDLQAFADKHDCVVASIGYRLSRWRWRALFLLNPLLLVLQMSLVCALLALPAYLGGWRLPEPWLPWLPLVPVVCAAIELVILGGWPAGGGNCRPREPLVTATEMASDVAHGISWIRENASSLGADPTRLHLAGHSAGAHLCAMVLCQPSHLESVGLRRSDINGVALLSGIFDVPLMQSEFPAGVRAFTRELIVRPAFGGKENDWAAQSPAQVLDARDGKPDASDDPIPPLLMCCGGREGELFQRQIDRFAESLHRAGAADVQTLRIAGKHHGTMVSHLGHRSKDTVGAAVAAFFGLMSGGDAAAQRAKDDMEQALAQA